MVYGYFVMVYGLRRDAVISSFFFHVHIGTSSRLVVVKVVVVVVVAVVAVCSISM